MLFHKSWICDGISKDGKQYPGGYKPHKPHKNSGSYCEICWKPRAAMIPKKSRQQLHQKVVPADARIDLSGQVLLSKNLQFFFILLVPTVTVFFACYTIATSLFKPAVELSDNYENINYSLKMKYPQKWQKQEQQDRTVTGELAVFFPQGKTTLDNCQPSVTLNVDDFEQKQPSVEEYKKSVIAKINTLNPNTKVTDESTPSTTLSNSRAYTLVYTRQEEKCNLQLMEVGTVKNNRAYYITYKADANTYDKFLKPAEEMMKSFEIADMSEEGQGGKTP